VGEPSRGRRASFHGRGLSDPAPGVF
jgi:hypothetical protein